MEQHPEIRTFVGETATQAFDGYAGFRLGTRYELHVTEETFDTVRVKPISIMRDGLAFPVADWPGAVMSLANYKKWFE